MKRFLFDGLCILFIVLLGRTYLDRPENETFEDKIMRFNAQVDNREIIETPENHQPLNQINENWAGQLGQKLSGFVVDVIDGSVRIVTSVFDDR